MPRYAQIKCDIYDDLVDEGYSQEAIAVYLFYSITSQNLIGLYRTVPNRDRVSAHIDTPSWEKGKAELELGGKVLWRDGYVWIVGKAKFVKGEKLVAAAKKCFSEIRNDVELKSLFTKKYDTLSIGNPLQDAPIPRPIPKPKPKNRDKETAPPSQNPSTVEKTNTVWEETKQNWKKSFGEECTNQMLGLLLKSGWKYVDALSQFAKEYGGKVDDPYAYALDLARNYPQTVNQIRSRAYKTYKFDQMQIGRIMKKLK